MNQISPIKFQELTKLTSLGIAAEVLKQANVSFESDKFITIKEVAPDGSVQFNIIDVTQNFKCQKKAIKSADYAIMHINQNIISVRVESGSSTTIQIANLTKKEQKSYEIKETVTFWHWVTPDLLGVVGDNTVYHINIATSTLEKIFDRTGQLLNSQILGYSTDSSGKWCMLFGISQGDQNQINGHLLLYFTETKQSQYIDGFAPSFGEIAIEDPNYKNSIVCFVSKKPNESSSYMNFMEIGKPKDGVTKFKKKTQIQYSPDVTTDLPILSQISEKHQLLFMITKAGYLFIYDIQSGCKLFRNRISTELILCSVKNSTTDGLICINKKGQVLGVNIDEQNFIPFIVNQCTDLPDNMSIALKIAEKAGLSGAEDLFVAQFNKLLASGNYTGAANIAYSTPNNKLRTIDTINKFKALPSIPGQPQPLLQYFSTILEKGRLNSIESLELVKPVLAQNKKSIIENWLKENKLECSDELAEYVGQYDPQLALSINLKSNNPKKVVEGYVETGQFDLIIPYCMKNGITPDYSALLKKIILKNPERAVEFAKMLCSREGGRAPLLSIASIFELFMTGKRIQEATAFLLEALKDNKPEDSQLQTKLFEINLMAAPKVAEAIFQMKLLTHYDKETIAKLCERAGLMNRALENYSDIGDIRRCIINTHILKKEEIIEFLGKLDPQKILICLQDLAGNRQNMQIVVDAAIKYSSILPVNDVIAILEKYGLIDAIYYFTGSLLPTTEDKDVTFKYIEAATKLNNMREVERVIRESKFYDPEKVRDWLKELKLQDPRALIYLCDIHGFVEDLTKYLYKNGFHKHIDIYLVKVNPQSSPMVCATLLELECDENYLKNLIAKIRLINIEPLIIEFEKRNKLKVLQNWLEARAEEGNQSTEVHTALAKIYVDGGKDANKFLEENNFYDPKVLGKYCENRDSVMSFTAYKKAAGKCDDDLILLSKTNFLYRLLARYLVERKDIDFWKKALAENDEHRKHLIEQVVQVALPETKNSQEVSCAVKAFLEVDLQLELMELLEKIVLHHPDFSEEANLQTLLIMTAMKSDKSRVMDYINRLEKFNGPKLAEKAISFKLFEEAFAIYNKFNNPTEAVDVLLTHLNDVERAAIFAEKINDVLVWGKLGNSQLKNGKISEAMQSYIKAKDPSAFVMVIGQAEREEKYEELIRYLKMCKEKNKDGLIDGELIYSLAKCNKIGEIEEIISNPNSADIQRVGDRCYEEKLFEAAKLLFLNIGNNGRLASSLVNLGQYQLAIDAAKKANTPKTWKEVNFACVRSKEFKLAAIAGQSVVVHPDHLEDVIENYETYGYWEELIKLLESVESLEQAHIGIFTELGVLYAKYIPTKLMDHLKANTQKLNIPKLLRACEQYQMWPETVFLYSHYDEFDKAVLTMIDHSPSAFHHESFVNFLLKIANFDIYYKAIRFYLAEQPQKLNDMLIALGSKLDLTKTVSELRKTGYLFITEPFLKAVQSNNVPAVNEALNEILLEKDDFEGLRHSVTSFDNFDQLSLAKALENHKLLEFRRISALLFRKNKKYNESIALSKKDEFYRDAIETALDSKSPEIVEQLLRFLASINEKESFAACLYTCYEYAKLDIVLELAWRANYTEFAMPFFIQSMKDVTEKLENVNKKTEAIEKKEEKAAEQNQKGLEYGDMMIPGLDPIQAIMPSPEMMMNMPGMQGIYAPQNQPTFPSFMNFGK